MLSSFTYVTIYSLTVPRSSESRLHRAEAHQFVVVGSDAFVTRPNAAGVPYRDIGDDTLVGQRRVALMITANVIKAVHDALQARGIEQRPEERFGDYVARGLGVSDAKAQAFLQYVHEGDSADVAKQKAGIETDDPGALLAEIARVIGSALGRLAR
jgi:hypothetical protein